jgi:outer membrane murein-binding lipoprotein Lpp
MKNTLLLGATVSLGFLLAGCQPTATNTTVTTNTNSANVNANSSNMNSANMNSANTTNSATTSAVETKEPEKYSAKVRINLETVGETQKATVPTLGATVARDGANRRMEISLPNNEKIVYLDVNGKNYIVSPDRKQYAELNKETLGIDVRPLLMPEQIVQRIQNQKGVEKVGEEQLNDRTVVKYRYGTTTNTQTQAGQVNTESFLLVDKETGLPMRSETVAASQNGQVQGMKQVRLVTEMSDISTAPAADLFAEPGADYKKVAPEEIRSQLNMLMQIAGTFAAQFINTAAQTAPSAAPSVSPTAK